MFSTGFAFLKNAAPAGPGYDPATTAFLDATGITDPTISSAINTLVVDLKAASLWSKFYAIYPFVGGSATTNKYNLVNPQDTDAAYRLTFNGGWSYSSNGVQGNATNTYANTHFVPSTNFSNYYNASLGYYASDTHAQVNAYINIPMAIAGPGALWQWTLDLGAGTNFGLYDPFSEGYRQTISPNADPQGLTWINNDSATLTAKMFRNATQVSTGSFTTSDPQIAYEFLVGRNNYSGGGTYYSGNTYQFTFISDAIGAANATIFYNIVQAFQTTLGRQV